MRCIKTYFLFNLLFILIVSINGEQLSKNRSFIFEASETKVYSIDKRYSNKEEQKGYYFKLDNIGPIYGIGISADVKLYTEASLVRVILIDEYFEEYLLYETYSLLEDDKKITIQSAAYETGLLNRVNAQSLRIELVAAEIAIHELQYTNVPPHLIDEIENYRDHLNKIQHNTRIDLLNDQIKKKGLHWIAGETSLSKKRYMEKKCLFLSRNDMLGNLQGVEYYIDGTFELKSIIEENSSEKTKEGSIPMVSKFDWRNRHGANDPKSPYYDGDKNGGGWATSLKNQSYPRSCGSCWTHSTNATAEIMANLYYNQHIDLDLAEQYMMSCSCKECCENHPERPCSGGYSTCAAKWLVKNGVTEEANFPYEASDRPVCADSGNSPKEHFYFGDGIYSQHIPSEDSLKRFLVHHGPLNVEIKSMWHCMCLVGYEQSNSGKTTWIYKNSYGLNSGKKGYLYSNHKVNDIKSADAFIAPAISKVYTDDDIQCRDEDGDGYYNWGFGPKPENCPDGCPDECDCDDSRPDLGPMLEDGSCKEIPNSIKIRNIGNAGIQFSCFPNPIKHTASINFWLPKNAKAKVYICDLQGNTINTLNLKSEMSGLNKAVWNTTNYNSDRIPNGIYICRIVTNVNRIKQSNSFKLIVSR